MTEEQKDGYYHAVAWLVTAFIMCTVFVFEGVSSMYNALVDGNLGLATVCAFFTAPFAYQAVKLIQLYRGN